MAQIKVKNGVKSPVFIIFLFFEFCVHLLKRKLLLPFQSISCVVLICYVPTSSLVQTFWMWTGNRAADFQVKTGGEVGKFWTYEVRLDSIYSLNMDLY